MMSGPNAYLDCVMVINLDRRIDRYNFVLGSLSSLKFNIYPDAKEVIRFPAHDGQDYPDTETVQKAAIADGFEEFGRGLEGWSVGQTAWYWSWRCALKHIIEIDKTVLLLIDDYVLKPDWSFSRIYNLVSECENDPHGFRLLQLVHSTFSDARYGHKPHTSMLAKGLSGSNDNGTILNPAGAQLLLDLGAEDPVGPPDADFGKLARKLHDSKYYAGIWYTLEDIVEHAHLDFESDCG